MTEHSRVIAGSCLVLGPALQALSTFFWEEHRQGIATGALIVLATVCWIAGLAHVFRDIEARVPRYAAVAFPLAVYGCVGGVAFGLQGMFEELFGATHEHTVQLLQAHPFAANVAFWIAGPLFPAGVFVLGLVLTRIRYVPPPAGLLMAAGAVVFPLSRIPREAAIAHAADLVLLLPFAYLGIRTIKGTSPRPSASPRTHTTEHTPA
ncbi:hypothetical protein [Actinomadura macrotermitis]|uniref:Uncharacterized protein n=1 Tax=Actinomadura macrotermitis TaxID=2585200 RepID=A0A7K0C7H9_9ACTN|nr:hypothetical protein [Actinomadura macrotermitis]MQY09393.1 hypothetical protein [Actinomadura macrotermitis]